MSRDYRKQLFYQYSSSPILQVLQHLMQNKLSDIGVELQKDQREGVEMREVNETEKFTSQVLYGRRNGNITRKEISALTLIISFPV